MAVWSKATWPFAARHLGLHVRSRFSTLPSLHNVQVLTEPAHLMHESLQSSQVPACSGSLMFGTKIWVSGSHISPQVPLSTSNFMYGSQLVHQVG
jgi:hypothetical protein